VPALFGELDLESGHTLASALRAPENAGAAQLVLDLSGVEFIDSTGMSVLVQARLSAGSTNRQFVLTNLSMAVDRLLHTAGIASHFTIC